MAATSSSNSSTPVTQREAMILTPNCGFRRSGRNEIFDDPAVATALLDRLLHHQVAEA